jgi:hypothetical protein
LTNANKGRNNKMIKSIVYTVLTADGKMYPASVIRRNKASYLIEYTLPDTTTEKHLFHSKVRKDGTFRTDRWPANNRLTLCVDGQVLVAPLVLADFTKKAEAKAEAEIARAKFRASILSVAELRERGWTASAIKKFLPETPDHSAPNPKYSTAGAPMKFWNLSRVEAAEQTDDFLAWRKGTGKRKEAAQRGIETKINKMVDLVLNAEITIERGWSDDAICDLAARTHGGNYEGDPGEFHWSNRTAVNCIRHNLTNYEALWKLINRGDTGQEAYELLRLRVDELIEEAYPQYFDVD